MLCLAALSNSSTHPHFHHFPPPPPSRSHSHFLQSRTSQQNTLLFSSFINPNPPKLNINYNQMTKKSRPSSFSPICYSSPPLSPQTLQWVCTVSSAVLMLAKGTAVQKTFLVPLFALQAPQPIFLWIKDECAWTIFLALLVRLFFFIPGELELPFMAMLLLAVAPYQIINLRGTQAGAIVSLLIAGYLAFQHFSRSGGGLLKAFDEGSAVATIAVICIAVVPCLLLI